MDLDILDTSDRPCGLYIGKRDGRIEISLDDYCDIVTAFFPSKESVDKAIEELIKLRKEIYG